MSRLLNQLIYLAQSVLLPSFPSVEIRVYLQMGYGKIPKISPGAYIFRRPFLRGLSTERNLRFKIDRASLMVGSKCTVFALFDFVFEDNFPSTSPRGAYI